MPLARGGEGGLEEPRAAELRLCGRQGAVSRERRRRCGQRRALRCAQLDCWCGDGQCSRWLSYEKSTQVLRTLLPMKKPGKVFWRSCCGRRGPRALTMQRRESELSIDLCSARYRTR